MNAKVLSFCGVLALYFCASFPGQKARAAETGIPAQAGRSESSLDRKGILDFLSRLEAQIKEKIKNQDYAGLPPKEWLELKKSWPNLSKQFPDLEPKKKQVEKLLQQALSLKPDQEQLKAKGSTAETLNLGASSSLQSAQSLPQNPTENQFRQFYDAAGAKAPSTVFSGPVQTVKGARALPVQPKRAGPQTLVPKIERPAAPAQPKRFSFFEKLKNTFRKFWKFHDDSARNAFRAVLSAFGKITDTLFYRGEELERRRLYRAMRQRLILEDHGSPAERKALERTLFLMLKSPTTREFSRKFLQENRRVRVLFENYDNSAIVNADGEKSIKGLLGLSQFHTPIPEASLTKLFLEVPGAEVRAAGVLSHELLGHILEHLKAERHGLKNTYGFYHNNELNAGLVGAITRAELDPSFTDPFLWTYLKNPKKYHEETTDPFSLTPKQMQNPLPAYRERLKRIRDELAETPKSKSRTLFWMKTTEHFISVHKKDPALFKNIRQQLAEELGAIPLEEKFLKEKEKSLKKLIRHFSSPEGKRKIRSLRKDSEHPFFQETEQNIQRHTEQLKKLLKGRPSEPSGQITMKQLEQMWKKDAKHHGSIPGP